ncbi:hypothetical protein [Radiobacillus sp. PE A8.2]|uniref:hypothetical protein n=1 Tax=Radiobacillus sp. PE A8.2 TaxID=3380349 RepID=UPI00388D8373
MIVQLTGNVTYPITLDPTVWIFDDRKLIFEEAFSNNIQKKTDNDEIKNASLRWQKEYHPKMINPPVNKTISKAERENIFIYTYVMPITDFVNHSEIKQEAKQAKIVTTKGDQIITLDQLKQCLLLFAKAGKPITDDGPVHLYFQDGSNKQEPIKGVTKIVIE